ncbi:MAG: phospho-sugar mutase [Desulfobacteraceae bacterium]|nr:phospho-sugar mutase [Desulfobacteraceae bacterium]
MNEISNADMIKKAEHGFKTLDLPDKYVNTALKWLEVWLTDKMFEDYVPQLAYLIESGKWDLLLDSFYQVIPFGTGGRRGAVGIGPNRINKWTIQASAQGHSQYLVKQHGEKAKQKGIVLTYDVRKYTQKGIYNDDIPNPVMDLDCKQLAIAAAEVYAANNIKVFMFDSVRSTPELSFAIRHLQAASGDMFSASHNLPTDNGKKVYDKFGGQLIPPHDQTLVDEVTENVKEIKTTDYGKAKEEGLIEYIGEAVDNAYHDAVCSVSLSQARNVKILYSPLHGTGITSVYPVLKKLNFDITLDPKTSNLSGAFENVTFNIPNPEVIESFGASLPFADEISADIIMSTDPDADRVGVMVKHKNSWVFLNGNEIGIILTSYAISKYRLKNMLAKESVIIKTQVTTSLIKQIALENGIQCISELLVGFKYIGHEMNKLEKENKIDKLILGTEESHGFIIGNYARDKDAAGAAIWISELAAELKEKDKTLADYLDEIYSMYGYCCNYLTEIRLLGAKGMEQIALIMDHLRKNDIKSFGEFIVNGKTDRLDGEPQPHLSVTDTSSRDVLIFGVDNLPNTQSIRMIVRPSGTEPKVKIYIEVFGNPFELENSDTEKKDITVVREKIEHSFMQYCYKILGIDFPERGFLLFWQLPLNDKLKYFETEDDITGLKSISDVETRRAELYKLLKFLGANPVEKVDKAFKEKFGVGIIEYLDLG